MYHLNDYLNDIFKKSDTKYITEVQGDKVVISDGTIKLSTFIIPLYEERIIGNNTAKSNIVIQLYCEGEYGQQAKVCSEKLFINNTLISLYGLKPFAGYKKCEWEMIFNVLDEICKQIQQKEKYSMCGWVDDNKCFLYGTKMITKENISSVESTLVQQITPLSVFDCRFMAELLPKISKDPFYGYTLVLHYLLSLLKERFYISVRFCPSYVLFIVGITGTGKSSSSMPLLNPVFLQSCCFEDSPSAIRRTLQDNNNGCTIVDDFKCNSLKNNEKFEEIVRLSGDITSNGKRVLNQKVDNTVVTGMAAFTGEEIPHLQASSFPRLFILEVEPGMIDFSNITTLTENIGIYNAFIVEFIRYVMKIENFDTEFASKVMSARDSLRMNQDIKGMHGRYYDIYGWLSTMWDYFTDFLSQHDQSVEYDYKKELQRRIINQFNRFDTDPVKLFARAFFLLKESNSFTVTDFNGYKSGYDFDIMEKPDYYFIRSGRVYQKIVSYFKNEGITFPCSERKLRSDLFDSEILIKQNATLLTTELKTAANKSLSGYYVSKHVLKKIGGNDNEI